MSARLRSRDVLGVLGVVCVLACAGPVEPEPEPCCSVEELVRLTESGVDEGVLLDTIRNNRVDLRLTAFDVAALSKAGMSRTVIDRIGGGPCRCSEEAGPDSEPVVVPVPTPDVPVEPSDVPTEDPVRTEDPVPTDGPTTLIFDLQYAGGKSFKLLNESGQPCIDAVVTMNGVYQWRHRQIERGTTKFLRLSKLIDPATGNTAEGQTFRTLDVQCAAGSWSTEL